MTDDQRTTVSILIWLVVVVLSFIWLAKIVSLANMNYQIKASVYTDTETGCEYISAGGLTPRLDASGKHMGCKH